MVGVVIVVVVVVIVVVDVGIAVIVVLVNVVGAVVVVVAVVVLVIFFVVVVLVSVLVNEGVVVDSIRGIEVVDVDVVVCDVGLIVIGAEQKFVLKHLEWMKIYRIKKSESIITSEFIIIPETLTQGILL